MGFKSSNQRKAVFARLLGRARRARFLGDIGVAKKGKSGLGRELYARRGLHTLGQILGLKKYSMEGKRSIYASSRSNAQGIELARSRRTYRKSPLRPSNQLGGRYPR